MSKKGRLVFALIMLFVCSGYARVSGQVFSKENQAELLYGKGVHAFFDGDYRESLQLLGQVEKLGSEDPRPYYFMALAYHRMKQDDKADEFFRKAARFEWVGQAMRDYKVSDALRRIQGAERLYVEMYRKQAKIDWQKEEKVRQQEKYGLQKTRDKDVLNALAQSFVGTAPFGARSVDPFRTPSDAVDAEPTTKAGKNPAQSRKPATPKRKSKSAPKKSPEANPFADPDDTD